MLSSSLTSRQIQIVTVLKYDIANVQETFRGKSLSFVVIGFVLLFLV
jgi:hypothetical protein